MSDTLHLFGTSLSITDHVRKALVIAILNAVISVSLRILNSPDLTTYNLILFILQAILSVALLIQRSGAVTNKTSLLILFLIVQVAGTLLQSSQPLDYKVIVAAVLQASISALALLEGEWAQSQTVTPKPAGTPSTPR